MPTVGAYQLVQVLQAEGFAPWPSAERWHGTFGIYATLLHPEGVDVCITTHHSPFPWFDERWPADGCVMQAFLEAPFPLLWFDVLPLPAVNYVIEVAP